MAWSDAADMIKFASHIFALKIDFDSTCIIKNFFVLKFQSVNSLHDNKSGGREEAPVGALVELLETEVWSFIMDKEQIKECQKSTGAILLQEILVTSHKVSIVSIS